MILVSWNCRNLDTILKINTDRDILIKEKKNIYMIQETKTSKKKIKK